MPCDLYHFLESQRSLTFKVDHLYKYMKSQELLNKKSDALFRTLLKDGKSDLWKNLNRLKQIYRHARKNRKCKCSDYDWIFPKEEPGLGCECIQPE